MLVDQRVLDGLLFMRRCVDRLRCEEGLGLVPPEGAQGLADVLESSRSAYTFTPAELVRLAMYRAAIQAGCYTDFFDSDGHPQHFV